MMLSFSVGAVSMGVKPNLPDLTFNAVIAWGREARRFYRYQYEVYEQSA